MNLLERKKVRKGCGGGGKTKLNLHPSHTIAVRKNII